MTIEQTNLELDRVVNMLSKCTGSARYGAIFFDDLNVEQNDLLKKGIEILLEKDTSLNQEQARMNMSWMVDLEIYYSSNSLSPDL